MSLTTPFAPLGDTTNVTAATTTAATALTAALSNKHVRVLNAGAVPTFLKFGDSTVTVTLVTGIPVGAGGVEVFNVGFSTHVATITASSTAVIYLTTGLGV